MTRLNGNGIALPPHEAAARQQEAAQEAALAHCRLQISAAIVGQLLPTYLTMHRARALLAAGKPADSLDSVAFDTAPAIDAASTLAVATADKLLEKLGLAQ